MCNCVICLALTIKSFLDNNDRRAIVTKINPTQHVEGYSEVDIRINAKQKNILVICGVIESEDDLGQPMSIEAKISDCDTKTSYLQTCCWL